MGRSTKCTMWSEVTVGGTLPLTWRLGPPLGASGLETKSGSPALQHRRALLSKDEYELCDVSNPVRMYTDGLDGIPLDGEGIRYFVSSRPESCKNGLKLHVDVMPLGALRPKSRKSQCQRTLFRPWLPRPQPLLNQSSFTEAPCFYWLGYGFARWLFSHGLSAPPPFNFYAMFSFCFICKI
ncbi:hypothetical protein CRYUN_Cryun31cG0006100 [Craigia yunnanensis]